ncbi:MAG TPA: hypothetical protein DEB56_01645 [Thiobacillus sp.]|nr:hypothetical protein [Thiobacillus sp.]
MHTAHPASLLVVALVLLRHPCSRSQASARLLLDWFVAPMQIGMGLPRDAFAAPIQTDIGEETITPRVEGARHIHPARLRHDCHV